MFEGLSVLAGEGDFGAVGVRQAHLVGAREPGNHFGDVVEVDEVGFVDADEAVVGQVGF